MAPPTFASLRSSLLFIPHEILGEILSHCDARTLAIVSRVSLACLELAGPLLYGDIVLKTPRTIVKLLRLKPVPTDAVQLRLDRMVLPKSKRVTPYTSLSLIKSLVFAPKHEDQFRFVEFVRPAPPLPIPILVFDIPASVSRHNCGQIADLTAIFPLVSPSIVVISGRPHSLQSVAPTRLSGFPYIYVPSDNRVPWTQLTTIVFSGINTLYLWLKDILVGRRNVAVPLDPLRRPRAVLDLTGAMGSLSSAGDRCMPIRALVESNRDDMGGGLDLCVWVRTEEQEEEAKQAVTSPELMAVRQLDAEALELKKSLVQGARRARDWETLIEMASSVPSEDATSSA